MDFRSPRTSRSIVAPAAEDFVREEGVLVREAPQSRSADIRLIQRVSVPRLGIRAFSVVGPSTWNGHPSELHIFNRTTSPAFFLTLRLLCLTVLMFGALLSSFLEEALYKCSL